MCFFNLIKVHLLVSELYIYLGQFSKPHFVVDYLYFATYVTHCCETIFIQTLLDITSCFLQ